jgi:hypothetical protein
MPDSIPVYEEALLSYFKDLEIDDGENTRNPQVLLAVSSRSASELIVSNDNTPVLPLLTLTRTGFSSIDASHIVKSHITRKFRMRGTQNRRSFMVTDLMPFEMSYKLDIWTLYTSHHLSLIEQIIWKLEKNPWVNVVQEFNGVPNVTPGYIRQWTVGDQTAYDNITEENYRIFKSSIDFKFFIQLVNDNYAKPSLLFRTTDYQIIEKSKNVDKA